MPPMALLRMASQQSTQGLIAAHPATHSSASSSNGSGPQAPHRSLRQRGVPSLRIKAAAASSPAAAVPHAGSRQQLFSEGECIEVDASFDAAEGVTLSPSLVIGARVGSGSTADVYKLTPTKAAAGSGGSAEPGSSSSSGYVSKQGQAERADQVLKWAKPLPGAADAFKREWMLGRRLNAAAQQEPALRILLQTGPAVVSRRAASNHRSGRESLLFRGSLLQGLNGSSLDSRLEEDGSFCDIDFMLAAAQQVLVAIDRGHHVLGFRHGDLRISNIMEDVSDPAAYEALLANPDTWRKQGYESAASAALDAGFLSFKLLDWGHSEIHDSRSRSVLLAAQGEPGASSNPYLSAGATASASLALQRLPPAKGIVELIYSWFYKDKSDPWRLLHSLAPRLDGRAWPERRRTEVLALYSLLDEVLGGAKLTANFFSDTEAMPDGSERRLVEGEVVGDPGGSGGFVRLEEAPALDVTAKPRRWRWFKAVRDVLLRLGSRFFSRKPRVSARHVLRRMEARGLLVLGPDGRLVSRARGSRSGHSK